MPRPAGITAIAIIFWMTAAYLGGAGLLMLARPGTISMTVGSPLLGGLELAGPWMFLLVATAAAAVGFGIFLLKNWARRIAVIAALLGILLNVPSVSSSLVEFRISMLLWGGLAVIVRVIVVWYLYQPQAREAFEKR